MYYVCLSVCLAIILESLNVGSSFSLIRQISREYVYEGHRVSVKVTGAKTVKILIAAM